MPLVAERGKGAEVNRSAGNVWKYKGMTMNDLDTWGFRPGVKKMGTTWYNRITMCSYVELW